MKNLDFFERMKRGGGGEAGIKNPTNSHPKMNLYRKFHLNWENEKLFKNRGTF